MTNMRSFIKSDIYIEVNENTKINITLPNVPLLKRGKIEYYNYIAAFDIETTSFYNQLGSKTAIMYLWCCGIEDNIYVGRTWKSFMNLISQLEQTLELNVQRRLIVYIHNLQHEFQYIRKHFKWQKVFAIEERTPIYALTTEGIEFRCSYLLSGYSLENLSETLTNYEIKKLVGTLNYNLIRHSKTKLTSKEIKYCINDVKVVMAFIQEKIDAGERISTIPYTKTGYVRRYCRNECFYYTESKHMAYQYTHYSEIVKQLTIEPNEYLSLKRAFQGGFTHANVFYSGKIMRNAQSMDISSSYPTVMVAERFPMSKGELITIESLEQFEHNLNNYCCMFDVQFNDINAKIIYENYISQSRCWVQEECQTNNGRVVKAKQICTTVTDVDWRIIEKFYDWKTFKINNFYRYKKGYLPTPFVASILALYNNKTKLKGLSGKESEYQRAKEDTNSSYGMTVTDIIREDILYTDHWTIKAPVLEKGVKRYNIDRNRFLFYPWGVWITAYARRNLFSAIIELGNDYIYSDTDSVKYINAEQHKKFFELYNKAITIQLRKALKYHKLSYDLLEPENAEGKHPLGVWDFDGSYRRFKTLGAKRYLVEYDYNEQNKPKKRGKIEYTVAGLGKRAAVKYLTTQKQDVFDFFQEDMFVPAEYTGKLTHTYIDEPRRGILKDYQGIAAEYEELSAVHLEPTSYTMSIFAEYNAYIKYICSKIYKEGGNNATKILHS